MSDHLTVEPLLDWYATSARDLPWRRPEAGAWAVLVSEVMLQQTPVVRVLPAYQQWLSRWPAPAALAAAAPGDAVRAWGRLGYPRRALRLHAAAAACVRDHDGCVPSTVPDLLALPGVGEYTAAAVAAFAFGQRALVLDTNVRRVLARLLAGQELQPPGATTAPERRRVDQLLPEDGGDAARVSVALMELGALVCTSRAPDCGRCPLASRCAWLAAGRPAWSGPTRRSQSYAGTDRQCRGRLLAVLRAAHAPVGRGELDHVWADDVQRERALDSLLDDGLVELLPPSPAHDGPRFRLPAGQPAGAS